MGNRKQPSPPPGSPGYRGPKQFKPTQPPAPPRKRHPFGMSDDLAEALRLNALAREEMNTTIVRACAEREDRAMMGLSPAPPPVPSPGQEPFPDPMPMIMNRADDDRPRSGGSRFRLARRGPYWRVEEWRTHGRLWWKCMGWDEAQVSAPFLIYNRLQLYSTDRAQVARTLDVLRQMETRDNAPGWTPDEDAG